MKHLEPWVLQEGSAYVLVLSAGALRDFAVPSPIVSPEIRLSFQVCALHFDDPATDLIRIVPPSGFEPWTCHPEWLESMALDAESRATLCSADRRFRPKRFTVSIEEGALAAFGENPLPNDAIEVTFSHDSTPPHVDAVLLYPPCVGPGIALQDTVVLTFNEAVQAGQGHFLLFRQGHDSPLFERSIDDLLLDGYVSDNKVVLPVYSARATLAYAASHELFLTTSGTGVVRDLTGNPWPVFDSRNVSCSFMLSLEAEKLVPEIVFFSPNGLGQRIPVCALPVHRACLAQS
jgi:hypothetical protein